MKFLSNFIGSVFETFAPRNRPLLEHSLPSKRAKLSEGRSARIKVEELEPDLCSEVPHRDAAEDISLQAHRINRPCKPYSSPPPPPGPSAFHNALANAEIPPACGPQRHRTKAKAKRRQRLERQGAIYGIDPAPAPTPVAQPPTLQSVLSSAELAAVKHNAQRVAQEVMKLFIVEPLENEEREHAELVERGVVRCDVCGHAPPGDAAQRLDEQHQEEDTKASIADVVPQPKTASKNRRAQRERQVAKGKRVGNGSLFSEQSRQLQEKKRADLPVGDDSKFVERLRVPTESKYQAETRELLEQRQAGRLAREQYIVAEAERRVRYKEQFDFLYPNVFFATPRQRANTHTRRLGDACAVVHLECFFSDWDAKWAAFANPDACPRAVMHFGELPWPVFRDCPRQGDLLPQAIRDFVLHPTHRGLVMNSPGARVTTALLRFERNYFESKVIPWVLDVYKVDARKAAADVFQILQRLLVQIEKDEKEALIAKINAKRVVGN